MICGSEARESPESWESWESWALSELPESEERTGVKVSVLFLVSERLELLHLLTSRRTGVTNMMDKLNDRSLLDIVVENVSLNCLLSMAMMKKEGINKSSTSYFSTSGSSVNQLHTSVGWGGSHNRVILKRQAFVGCQWLIIKLVVNAHSSVAELRIGTLRNFDTTFSRSAPTPTNRNQSIQVNYKKQV